MVAKLKTISSVVCPFCGCLCDDIEITVDNGKIVKNKNGCVLSQAKFLNFNNEHRIQKSLMRKNGVLVEVSFEEAVATAADILANAHFPVLYGWSSTSCEAQRIGIELAEEVGGVFDNTSTVCHGPSVLGMQEEGIPSCTLGDVRHRADLILYWGCDPFSSHPRHMQRYTMFSEGRFGDQSQVQAGSTDVCYLPQTLRREDRKLLVVDVRKTSTGAMADFFLQVEPNKDYELISALRMLVNDQEIDVESVAEFPWSISVKLLMFW